MTEFERTQTSRASRAREPTQAPPLRRVRRLDGSVLVPAGAAAEMLRVLVVGLTEIARRDGGEVSAGMHRLLYALHDAAEQHDQRTAAPVPAPAGAATGSDPNTRASVDLSIDEAAARLECSPRWVRQLVSTGRIQGRRAGQRAWLVDADDFERYRRGLTRDERKGEQAAGRRPA